LQASLLAMKKAILRLKLTPRLVLVDGNKSIPNLDFEQKNIIKGDDKVPLISAASIVAKVTRDRIMKSYSKVYQGYFFDKNKGYGTKQHFEAIEELGLSTIHRVSFNTSKQLKLF
jgi:ribonuclease HII